MNLSTRRAMYQMMSIQKYRPYIDATLSGDVLANFFQVSQKTRRGVTEENKE